MEDALCKHPFIVGDAYTIADIALYASTHCAGDGGYQLDGYPRIAAWLCRVASQPGFVAMLESADTEGVRSLMLAINDLTGAARLDLIAAGLFFLSGLLTGVLQYTEISQRADAWPTAI